MAAVVNCSYGFYRLETAGNAITTISIVVYRLTLFVLLFPQHSAALYAVAVVDDDYIIIEPETDILALPRLCIGGRS